jgi:hypothetical protein
MSDTTPQEVVAKQLCHLFPEDSNTPDLLAVEILEALRTRAQSEYVPKSWIHEILGFSPQEKSAVIDAWLVDLDEARLCTCSSIADSYAIDCERHREFAGGKK